MNSLNLLMLAQPGKSTRIVYNSLNESFEIENVIVEDPVPKTQVVKRRSKSLGIIKVLGQILFYLTVPPYLEWSSKERIAQIMSKFDLNTESIKGSEIKVDSVNSPKTISLLEKMNPDIVVVNGTRIISEKTLASINTTFINMHAGITPLYRGVHGAYWALVERRAKACGVTIHLIDSGIDTGDILDQAIIEPTQEDNFSTYPLLQLAKGLPLLKSAIKNVVQGKIEKKSPPAGESKLWSHPTLWEYIYYRFRYGVK